MAEKEISAREAAWRAWWESMPDEEWWDTTKRANFRAGYAAGIAEGLRLAREAAAPSFEFGSKFRRENYVRHEIASAIDALNGADRG